MTSGNHSTIIRRGFGRKSDVSADLATDYHSPIIERIRANGNRWQAGGLRFRIAAQFGFCYGVDKAIDFAYETRRQFPEKRIFLTHEIIHNPRVNARLVEMGIQFLSGKQANGSRLEEITPADVVLLPAFGVDVALLERLKGIGCVLVDTTCGSVIHVWKRVERYARDGFTSVIHGKYAHEETIATCSYVTKHPGAHYMVVFNEAEAQLACDFICSGQGGEALLKKITNSISPGFNPARDLAKIGFANQTTMLSSESLAIAEMFRQALAARYGAADLENRFRSFETICSATQERQDAVMEMMVAPPDVMLVVGGFNSSNTTHLCEIASKHCPTYHIDEVDCLISPNEIRHRPPHAGAQPLLVRDWLPARRPLEIGLTAGASTPNRVIGEAIERLASWEA